MSDRLKFKLKHIAERFEELVRLNLIWGCKSIKADARHQKKEELAVSDHLKFKIKPTAERSEKLVRLILPVTHFHL